MSWWDEFIENTGNAWDDLTGAITGRDEREAAEEAAVEVEAVAETAAESQIRTGEEVKELSLERFGEAKELLDPYVGEARTAREQMMVEMGLAPGTAGTAYMETPGYESLLEERRKGVKQAAAGAGSLYSGRRVKAAADVSGATQGQFYTNYMNMLSNLGSPGVATNLASLGVGQAATIGQQQLGAQQIASGYLTGGAQQAAGYGMAASQATSGAIGDIIGAGASLYGGYLAGGGGRPPAVPYGVAAGDAYMPAYQAGYI